MPSRQETSATCKLTRTDSRRTAAVGSDAEHDVEDAGHVAQVDSPPRRVISVRHRAGVRENPIETQLSVHSVGRVVRVAATYHRGALDHRLVEGQVWADSD